jgi:cell division septum initiation protein DivIVA
MQLEGPRSDDSAEQATDDGEARAPEHGSGRNRDESPDSPLDRFLPHSLRTGRRRAISRRDQQDTLPDAGETPLEVPRQLTEVGAHVELVLAAAEHAAKQIRREAQEAASEIRVEAGRDAARIHNEAEEALRASERERAEVEQYVGETRAAADSQAQQALRQAEAEAEKVRAEAARQAGRIVVEAERRGQEMEDAARRRTEELAHEADDIEARMDELLGTLRGLTEQLERRLAVDSPGDAEAESLDEALAPPKAESKEPSPDRPSRAAPAKPRSQAR